MKNFSNAVVLSLTLLVTAGAQAKNNDANFVANQIGMTAKEFNQKACFFGKNKKAFEALQLDYILGASKSDVKSLASYLKAAQIIKANLEASVKTVDAAKLLVRVNKFIARITNDCRFRKAYRDLFYKGNVCKLEKREFRKIAALYIKQQSKVEAAA
jgi:hypothetical protein